jgi:tRNA pseudouridine55 synthase
MRRRFAPGASAAGAHAARGHHPLELDTYHGLIAIDKPVGPTSHDVVLQVRRRLGSPGAGHLGTLDPAASGLLVMALGAATRALQVWAGGEKTYEGTLRLGVITRSQDLTGEIIDQRPVRVGEEEVRAASRAFVGPLRQVPPMVSAVKVGGERLHNLARRGIEVTRPPRSIHVADWEWLDFALPLATFRVRCSAGTYVRTLAHDLGLALGCGAALAELCRLRSEPFGLERAVTPEAMNQRSREELLRESGIPLDEALRVLPAVTLAEARRSMPARRRSRPARARWCSATATAGRSRSAS